MILENKNKKEILEQAKSPYDDHCIGYPGQGPYFTGFMMGSSSVPIKFGHKGSFILDKINAFDIAEVTDTYLGQINMITVSSFCGPHGLLWGYDINYKDYAPPTEILTEEDIKEFEGVTICNGKNLRIATKSLFGTLENKKFPLYPGSHVFTAQKFLAAHGPINLYGAFAVGIPENRSKNACLFMEDIGEMKKDSQEEKRKLLKNIIESAREIGRNQKVSYKVIYADIITQKVNKKEIGGVLVAAPYFLLAKNAYPKFIN